jgi:hypothetical protein
LIAALERPGDEPSLDRAVDAMVLVAPRLLTPQAERAWSALRSLCQTPSDLSHSPRPWDALVALAPRVEGASRDARVVETVATFLDYSCSDMPVDAKRPLDGETVIHALLKHTTSGRSLAKLLAHPGCVGHIRQRCVERLEEILFYEGRSVWKVKEKSIGFYRVLEYEGPARRFRNLHDAAVWIQQNWPDFDLETNCPVTWRGSR